MSLNQEVLMNALTLSSKALSISTPAELESLWQELKDMTGLKGIIFGAAISGANNDLLESHLYTYDIPKGWLSYYGENDCVTSDPVMGAAMETGTVMTWAESIEWSITHKKYDQNMDSFREIAASFGLKFGVVVGKRAHAITQTLACTSVTNGEEPISDDTLLLLRHVLPHLNEILVRPGFIPSPELSKREVEVLGWAKVGKSYWETSQILNISERTVKFHLENSYKKLNVTNRSQAVAKAMQLGVIRFDSSTDSV